ncbi:MAG: hypothetical protein ABSE64_08030 [Vulcanimicrobiaceae bacterium]|jgi:hypothetical protein
MKGTKRRTAGDPTGVIKENVDVAALVNAADRGIGLFLVVGPNDGGGSGVSEFAHWPSSQPHVDVSDDPIEMPIER